MSGKQAVEEAIARLPENELIPASAFYHAHLAEQVTEAAYYKALERLRDKGVLEKAGKGVYYRPKQGRFGPVPLSENAILHYYTADAAGMAVGYTLYNALGLTTQIPGTVEVYSSRLEQQTKTIRSVRLTRYPLVYGQQVQQMVSLLEILHHYYVMQDLNKGQYLAACKSLAESYSDEVFEAVNTVIRYPKRTIAFLKSVLDHYGVPNHLSKYLSGLSDYRYPRMEELYEAARASQ